MQINKAIERNVNLWIKYANEDLRLARYGMTMQSTVPYRLIAYHAQQSAEKYLKALLVKNRIDFPYTHNILRLIELLAKIRHFDKSKIESAIELSYYAITTRYPGEETKVTKSEAIKAIKIAEKVGKYILPFLK